ncbi:hypothetical protein Q604_UNBC11662G0001 [human gut metagenome]|uniref:Uncharacterized protein n=1 Tax=human gut metagenome TaxID=408170 RepID=W1XWT0_9ZZZZ
MGLCGGIKMKLPFQIDLNDKVVVITGAGGLIKKEISMMMKMHFQYLKI